MTPDPARWARLEKWLEGAYIKLMATFCILAALLILIAIPLIVIAALPFLLLKVVWEGIRRGYEA